MNPLCLTNIMQADFDRSQLAKESDSSLLNLQSKIEKAIKGWQDLKRELDRREQAWYQDLMQLEAYLINLLAVRYGCND